MSLLCRNVLVLPKELKKWAEGVVYHGLQGIPIGEVFISEEDRIKLWFKSYRLIPDEFLAKLSLYSKNPVVHRAVVDIGYYLVRIYRNGMKVFEKEKDFFFYSPILIPRLWAYSNNP